MKLARGEVWLAKAAAPERTRAASNREVLEAVLAARPVLVVSPPEFNDHLRTVIVVPISRDRASAPFRPAFRLDGERTVALVDQVRTIERSRFVRRVGKLSTTTLRNVLETLRLAFEP